MYLRRPKRLARNEYPKIFLLFFAYFHIYRINYVLLSYHIDTISAIS